VVHGDDFFLIEGAHSRPASVAEDEVAAEWRICAKSIQISSLPPARSFVRERV
jgi:hypothetical protein